MNQPLPEGLLVSNIVRCPKCGGRYRLTEYSIDAKGIRITQKCDCPDEKGVDG